MSSEIQNFLIDSWGECDRRYVYNLIHNGVRDIPLNYGKFHNSITEYIKEIIFGIKCPKCKKKLHSTFVSEETGMIPPVPESISSISPSRYRIVKTLLWCECGFEYAEQERNDRY